MVFTESKYCVFVSVRRTLLENIAAYNMYVFIVLKGSSLRNKSLNLLTFVKVDCNLGF